MVDLGRWRDWQDVLEVMPIRFGDGRAVRSESKRDITDNSKILDSTNCVVEEDERNDHIQDMFCS